MDHTQSIWRKIGKVCLWVFFFPIMVSVTVVKKTELKRPVKICLATLAWLFYLLVLLGIFGQKEAPRQESSESASSSSASITSQIEEKSSSEAPEPAPSQLSEAEKTPGQKAESRAPVIEAPPVEASSKAPEKVAPTSRTVYVTRTGKRYHFSSKCAGKAPIPTTLDEAVAEGFTPCKKCAGG